jgi:hypothetical protein
VSVRTSLATEKACWNKEWSNGPGAAGLGGDAVGLLHLAEDLRLAEHGRIEAAGDREGVADRQLVVELVQAAVRAFAEMVVLVEPFPHARQALLGAPAVELGAVAGRDDQHLVHLRQPTSSRSATGRRSGLKASFSRISTGAER